MPTTPTPGGGAGANAGNGSATVELNTSLVILPKRPMQPRYFDPRIGYFTVGYTDFDANPQGIKDIQLIKRWRLEVKPQDIIFKELKTNQAIDIYRRNLQKTYVAKLIELVKPATAPTANPLAQAGGGRRETPTADPEKEDTDVLSVAKAELRSIDMLIKTSLPATTDTLSSYHLQDLSDWINLVLNPKG